MHSLLILLLWSASKLTADVEGKFVDVNTDLGLVRGVTMESRLGLEFQAFRGIRYAEPPVGLLRFRDPQPVSAWKPKVFDASTDGPMCPQLMAPQNLSELHEDCLRLNVYTKDVHAERPVIVYIHPGGFYSGGSLSKNYAGPQNLMERDIVLVTLNYRLGTFGYLATGTSDAPGNAGFKDQVVALRWIQKHIRNFGGDPNSVTLFGYSAGSMSIGLHMLSPMAKNLFHRGIAMSASALGQWEYQKDGLMLAERQARLLDCPVKPVTAMVQCLQTKPMMDFVRTQPEMFDYKWNPVLNWMPVIEADFGQERYLIEDPFTTVNRGQFYKVPLIVGINEFEFIYIADSLLRNDSSRQLFNDQFEKYASIVLLYERNKHTAVGPTTAALRSYYLKNETLNYPSSRDAFGRLYSDGVIGYAYHRFVKLMAPHLPVYTYLFTYRGRYGHYKRDNRTYGPVHHDELLYLLHVPVLTPMFKRTDPENTIIEQITRLWTEFATKSNPNNISDEYLKGINWPEYTSKGKEYLNIGSQVQSKSGGIFPDRFAQWDSLFPLPSYGAD